MMVWIGNFFFRYRNGLFPLFYLLLCLKSPPLLSNYGLALAIGFLIALAGQFLRAITIGLDYIVRGGRNRRVYAEGLVQGGMFAHCRNPLYLGNFLILVGVGVASNSVFFMAAGIPFFCFAYAAIIAAEEDYLRNKFGDQFTQYCRRVNRILPNLAGISATFSGMRFNWRRLILAEYGSTFAWLTAMILVTLKNLWLNGEYKPIAPRVWQLWSALAVVTIAYLIARFLKKSGLLAEKASVSSP